MQHVMNHRRTHRVLAIALSACFGIWLSVGSSAWAQDTAATPQTDAAQSTTDSAAEPKLRKRLIDVASEAEEWNPEYHPDPELEMRDMLAQADRAYAAGRVPDETAGALVVSPIGRAPCRARWCPLWMIPGVAGS